MPIKIKEGRYYRDNYGRVRGPMRHTGDEECPWQVSDVHGAEFYTDSGSTWGGIRGHLFCECAGGGSPIEDKAMTEAAKADAPEAKPEPIAITQEMVNRAILDAVKAGQAGRAVEINDAWDDLLSVMHPANPQDDGWIKWEGGGQPVSDAERVQVKLSCGVPLHGRPGQFQWLRVGNGMDVVAYRIVK